MPKCEGRKKLEWADPGVGGSYIFSTDWFESDDPEAKGKAIRKFVRTLAEKTKDGKQQEPCSGDCGDDKYRECLPFSLSVELPKDAGGWFKGVSTELDGIVYEAYVVKSEDTGTPFKMTTECRCTKLRWF